MGLGWTLLRFQRARGKAARAKVIGGAKVPTILAWIAAAISFFFILGFGGSFLPPFVAMLAAPGLATAVQLLASRLLKRSLASYRLPCAACSAAMDMIDDSRDEQFLTAEEAAEEKAGGMDYEFWRCPKCGAEESLKVKLNKASQCPQCKRRSLTSNYRDHGGGHEGTGRQDARHRDLPQSQVQLQQDPRALHAAPLFAKFVLVRLLAPRQARSAAAAPAAEEPAESSRTISVVVIVIVVARNKSNRLTVYEWNGLREEKMPFLILTP